MTLWLPVTSCVKDYKGHSLMQTSFTEPPNTCMCIDNNVCARICITMCGCMWMNVCMCVSVCWYTWMCIGVFVCVCVQVCINAFLRGSVCGCMVLYTYTACVWQHNYVCAHACVYKCISYVIVYCGYTSHVGVLSMHVWVGVLYRSVDRIFFSLGCTTVTDPLATQPPLVAFFQNFARALLIPSLGHLSLNCVVVH